MAAQPQVQVARNTSDGSIIDELRRKLEELTLTGHCGRPFIRVEELRNWLLSGPTPDIEQSRASRLLWFAYKARNLTNLPKNIQQLCNRSKGCLVLLCILTRMGHPHLLDGFIRRGIVDEQLPMRLTDLETETETMRIEKGVEFAKTFDELQWQFFPVKFDLNMGLELQQKHVVPVCKRIIITDKGGTAVLYQLEVLEEFVAEDMRKKLINARFKDRNDGLGYRYAFALKSFKEGNRDVWLNECESFWGLREHDGMVRYLGNFSHREPRPEEDTTEMTFNILLEYGDFDLEDYLYGTAQPIFPWEIINFWKSLFDVADAVEGIHNLKIPNGSGGFRKYNGWHADIKPDNILSVRGTFKLADPGFAKFQKHTGKEATEMILGGTQTYGAPERNPDRRGTLSEVSQKIDTWSLGCVFSEVATWVILGWQGVLQFRRLRKNATKAIMDSRKHASLKRIHRLKAGDYFHDGRDVLEIVKKWHETLRRLLRMGTTDPITIQVLDLIDSKMLVGPPAERKRIEDICKDLRDIERTTSEPPLELPDGIMEALVEMDAAAPAHIASEKRRSGIGVLQHHQTHGSLTIAEEREARKSKMLGEPMMKTAHRSEYRKSAITRLAPTIEVEGGVPLYESPVEDLEGDDGLKISMDPSTPAKAAPMRKKGGLSPPPPLPHSPPELSREQFTSESQSEPLIRTVTRRPRPARRRTTVSQDVFQAREEVEKREKGNVFRKTRKDQLLSGHFKHRDIKFLVDNAESMKKHWYEAKYLLETLLMKAAGQDDDGADMSFTVGNCQVKGKKDKKEFMKAMNVASPTEGHNTDMKMALGEIFNDYLNQLKTHKKFPHLPMKNLTLIVFTDGIWAGMRNKEDVFHKIVAFVREVDEIGGKMKERPVSIEFIQFGDDADATHRLRRLDDDMPWHGVRDIADTEHSKGDIIKMLLGSFVEEYDMQDEAEEAVINNPFDAIPQLNRASTFGTIPMVPHGALQIPRTPDPNGSHISMTGQMLNGGRPESSYYAYDPASSDLGSRRLR